MYRESPSINSSALSDALRYQVAPGSVRTLPTVQGMSPCCRSLEGNRWFAWVSALRSNAPPPKLKPMVSLPDCGSIGKSRPIEKSAVAPKLCDLLPTGTAKAFFCKWNPCAKGNIWDNGYAYIPTFVFALNATLPVELHV